MSIEGRMSRRRFLGGAGGAALGAAGSIACPRLVFAQNKKSVQFTLPWVAEGSNLFTFVAKGMGFWEKHGLDVDIARGSGSLAAAQAIAKAGSISACALRPSRSCKRSEGCRRWRLPLAHMTQPWASAC